MIASIALSILVTINTLITMLIIFLAYKTYKYRVQAEAYLKDITDNSEHVQEMTGVVYEMTYHGEQRGVDSYEPTDTTDYTPETDMPSYINWPTTMDSNQGSFAFNSETNTWDNMEDVDGITPDILKDLGELFDMDNLYEGPKHLKDPEKEDE